MDYIKIFCAGQILRLCPIKIKNFRAILVPQQTTEAATSQGRVLPSPKGPSGADKGRTAPRRLFLKRALYPVTPYHPHHRNTRTTAKSQGRGRRIPPRAQQDT